MIVWSCGNSCHDMVCVEAGDHQLKMCSVRKPDNIQVIAWSVGKSESPDIMTLFVWKPKSLTLCSGLCQSLRPTTYDVFCLNA